MCLMVDPARGSLEQGGKVAVREYCNIFGTLCRELNHSQLIVFFAL